MLVIGLVYLYAMTILRSTLTPTVPFLSRSLITRIATFIFVLLLTAFIFIVWDDIERLGSYGYPAVFILSLVANAAFLLPAPGIALVAAAGGAFDPIAVGVVAGLGAALGELTGYLLGYSGQDVFDSNPLYWRIEKWMKKSGTVAIFLLAAIPNPVFDLGGVIAGTLRMPVWRFLLGAWLGKSLRFALIAMLGAATL